MPYAFISLQQCTNLVLKMILLNPQNNYVDAAESFNILAICLSILHNYFDDSNEIIFRFIS